MPTFGSTIGNAVSSTELQSVYLRNPLWTNEVLLKRKKPGTMSERLIAQGHMRSGGTTNLPIRYSIEKDRYTNFIVVDVRVAPAIGANQTYTISTGTYNQNGQSKAYVGAKVRFPNGTVGTIDSMTYTANNNVITVSPWSWPQLPATAQGDQLILLASAVGEDHTPITDSLHTDVWAYRHGLQNINWATKLTDFKMAFDMNGRFTGKVESLPSPFMAGGTTDVWTCIELDDWYKSKMEAWNSTLTLGTPRGTTGPVTLADGDGIQGILPFLQAGANQFVTPSGNYTIADLDIIAQGFIDAGYGSVKHDIWAGRSLWTKLNNLLLSLPGQDTRQGEKNTYYEMAYKGLNGLGGHDFSYTLVEEFSDPDTGFPGAGFQDMGFIIPDATVADTLSGSKVPLLSIYTQDAYKGMEGGLGSGMFKWNKQTGPSFTPSGAPVTTAGGANHLLLIITGAYQTVFQQPDQFGLIM